MKCNLSLVFLCTLFFFSGCSGSTSEITLIDSDAVQPADSWSPAVSFWGDGLIRCESDGEEFVFEIHACDGSFFVQDGNEPRRVSDLVIDGAGDAYWQYWSASDPVTPWAGTKTFLEVLIKKGDSYVGYAVVKVERPENIGTYSATVLVCKEVLHPGSNGQSLSSETIRQMMDAAKQENG